MTDVPSEFKLCLLCQKPTHSKNLDQNDICKDCLWDSDSYNLNSHPPEVVNKSNVLERPNIEISQ